MSVFLPYMFRAVILEFVGSKKSSYVSVFYGAVPSKNTISESTASSNLSSMSSKLLTVWFSFVQVRLSMS